MVVIAVLQIITLIIILAVYAVPNGIAKAIPCRRFHRNAKTEWAFLDGTDYGSQLDVYTEARSMLVIVKGIILVRGIDVHRTKLSVGTVPVIIDIHATKGETEIVTIVAVETEVEVEIKYAGYIRKQIHEVDKLRALESKKLRDDIDYNAIGGLRIEARQKLSKIRPITVGQASRISGVSPADINVLLVYLEKENRNGK